MVEHVGLSVGLSLYLFVWRCGEVPKYMSVEFCVFLRKGTDSNYIDPHFSMAVFLAKSDRLLPSTDLAKPGCCWASKWQTRNKPAAYSLSGMLSWQDVGRWASQVGSCSRASPALLFTWLALLSKCTCLAYKKLTLHFYWLGPLPVQPESIPQKSSAHSLTWKPLRLPHGFSAVLHFPAVCVQWDRRKLGMGGIGLPWWGKREWGASFVGEGACQDFEAGPWANGPFVLNLHGWTSEWETWFLKSLTYWTKMFCFLSENEDFQGSLISLSPGQDTTMILWGCVVFEILVFFLSNRSLCHCKPLSFHSKVKWLQPSQA